MQQDSENIVNRKYREGMISLAKDKLSRLEVIRLWKDCFEDTEEFIQLYFERKYKGENTLLYRIVEGEALGALQMLPYPMTYAGSCIDISYISGACTIAKARNEGIMKRLLLRAFEEMGKRNVVMSTLIPQEAWLFDYYRRLGYAPVFDYTWGIYGEEAGVLPDNIDFEFPEKLLEGDTDLYDYFASRMRARACCVQHTREDFECILDDLCLSGGELLVARDAIRRIVGMAFVLQEKEQIRVNDWFYDSEIIKNGLLAKIRQTWGVKRIECKELPHGKQQVHYGMARIIDVPQMLELYAVCYPEKSFVVEVADEQIAQNTGIYTVRKGSCEEGYGLQNFVPIKVDVAELTSLLLGYHPDRIAGETSVFEHRRPYMSLMLD